MSTPDDRRTRKRLAMRQTISDAATALFLQRGFDQVTVDEIAAAADVSRMTVFNHFARKEDMFFDLNDLGRQDLRDAFKHVGHDLNVTPLEALRLFVHQAVAEQRPYTRFVAGSEKFVETIMASEALKARARAIRDELTETLAVALSEAAGLGAPDLNANLAAALILSTWGVAFIEGQRVFRESHDAEKAQAIFLAIIDRGSRGVDAAMKGTPYA